MSFARSRVQAVLQSSEVGISHRAKVCFLWIHAADEAVEIFIRASFLRTVRMGKVAAHVELLLDLEVAEVLAAAGARGRLPSFVRSYPHAFYPHPNPLFF